MPDEEYITVAEASELRAVDDAHIAWLLREASSRASSLAATGL